MPMIDSLRIHPASRDALSNTNKSKEFYERAVKVLPEGVSSGARGPLNYKPFPPYMTKAKGSHVWDVDGNEYMRLATLLRQSAARTCASRKSWKSCRKR